MRSPERDLLLAVASANGDIPAAAARVFDWNHAIADLALHGLISMVPATAVPAAIARRIAALQMHAHHRNEVNVKELVRFSDALASRGVRSVAYKGAVVAQRFYGDIGVRAYGDFDVLVARESLPAVDRVLEELQYMPMMYTTAESTRNRRKGFEESWQAHSEAVLDLHWHITDAFFPIGLSTSELLLRSIVQQLPDGSVRTMSDEDHLIVLATHAARHFFERLEWLKTIGVAMTRPGLDWDAIAERVARARCSTAFVSACRIAATFLGYPLPAKIESIPVNHEDVDLIVAAVSRDLVVARRYTWRLFDRRRDAFRRTLKMIFEPRITDTRVVSLPHSIRGVYYVLRPLRLVLKALRDK